MSRFPVTGALAATAIAFVVSIAHAQYVDVPTFVAGTPTFAPALQETDVAVGADGKIAIVWMEFDGGWGPSNQIASRMYLRSGVALGPPTRIDTSGGAGWPILAARDSGGFIAGWMQTPDGSGGNFYTRWLDSLARGVTSEIRVDTPYSGPASARSLAYLPTGPAYLRKQNGFWFRRYDNLATPLESATSVGDPRPSGFDLHIEALPDGGFIAVWPTWEPPYSWARAYYANGQPRGPAFTIDATGSVQSAAVSPNGEIAAVGRAPDLSSASEVWTRRFRADSTLIGSRQVVRTPPAGTSTTANADFDSRGNLLVVWSEYDSANYIVHPPRARAYDPSRTPLGPDIQTADAPSPQEIGIARTHDDCFATSWYYNYVAYMNFVCLCGAGNTECGDGVLDSKCEICDDGNRVDGDGCDSNCEPSACGNGIVTTGEQCDDGNVASGDGCDTNRTVTACGNGIVTQGEQCDDGNGIDGDGCDTNCAPTGCGNGVLTAGEECEDGNLAHGDGCEADCTLPEIHDSVLFSLKPIDIRLPSGEEPTTRNVVLQVQNADVLPDREIPGHVVRLTGSDGNCPAGTISRMPDFEAGLGGVQDTKQVDGGLLATALADITVSRATFKPVDRRVPARCTLWFSVSGIPEEIYDPTPDNNIVAVELNVYDNDAAILQTEDEVLIQSLSPALVKIPRGHSSVVEQIKPTVLRAGK